MSKTMADILAAAQKEARERLKKASLREPFPVGQTLSDTYTVESAPIHGGMGSVWKVRHRGWDVELAMKRPKEEYFIRDERQKEHFTHECEAWIDLGLHPHIVSCYFVRDIGGVPTVFSEWMDGGSLKDAIRDGRLYDGSAAEQGKRLLDVAIQFARGLLYAHEQGLIHRDVKPDNVLLTKDWGVKVADFGLVSAAAELTPLDKLGTYMARSGGYTLPYCSPEQMNGKALTGRTDIYSWAVSVMEMYLGERLWLSGEAAGLNCKDYCRACRVPMPEALQSLLAACMAARPEGRPHNFAEIEEALRKIYRETVGIDYPRPVSAAVADTADSLNNRALSYLELGKSEEAVALWERALEENPTASYARYNYTLFRFRQGTLSDREADMFMHELLGSNAMVPDSPVLELYGRLLMEIGGKSAVDQVIYGYIVEQGLDSFGHRLEAMRDRGELESVYQLCRIRDISDYEKQQRLYAKALDELHSYVEKGDLAGVEAMQVLWDDPAYADLINRRDFLSLFEQAGRKAVSLRKHRHWTLHVLPGASRSEELSFSADSRFLLCGERLYEVETGRLLSDNRRGEETRVLSHLSPDGSFYFRSNEDGFERVDAFTGSVTAFYDCPMKPNTLCISPDGQYVLAAGDWMIFDFWNLRSGEKKSYCYPYGGIRQALIRYDNAAFLLLTDDLLIRFDRESCEPVPLFKLDAFHCLHMAANTFMTKILLTIERRTVTEYAGIIVLDTEKMTASKVTGRDINGFPLVLTENPVKAKFSHDDTHLLYGVESNVWTYSLTLDTPLELHSCPGALCDFAESRNGKYMALSNGEKVYIKRSVRFFARCDEYGYPLREAALRLAVQLCRNEPEEEREEMIRNSLREFIEPYYADKCIFPSAPETLKPYARVLLSANPHKTPEALVGDFIEELADRSVGPLSTSAALAILRGEKRAMEEEERS